MNFNFLKGRWGPIIILSVSIITLSFLHFSDTEQFAVHSDLISIITTLFFIFYTYEMIRMTRNMRQSPFINVEFIILSKLNKKFLERHLSQIKRTQAFNDIEKEMKELGSFDKNLVFVKVENIGEVNAIDTVLSISYEKKNLDESKKISKEIPFSCIKKGCSFIYLLETYKSPKQDDYFKIQKGIIEFSDTSTINSEEKPKKNDFGQGLPQVKYDKEALVTFTV